MSYTALYRKFRPAKFDDVKGQDHIVTTLKNQIKNQRTSHAYLFCGTRGTGKTSIAKIFAKAVNCENPVDGSPCGECAMCRSISDGTSMNVIEIDAASNNGVDSIRQIVEEVSYSPTMGRYKVYIIDEVHMLSIGAFNALLKTLEEPPSYVIFILATTEVHKIPITILSRCQRYDFRRISIENISERLNELIKIENVSVEEKAIRYIAKSADGAMRDALSLLDQCLAFYFDQELTYDRVLDVLGAVDTEVFSRLFRTIIASDVSGAMKLVEEIVIQGRELGQFVTDMTWYLRNLLLLKSSEANEDVIDISSENMVRLKEEATMADSEVIMRYIRIMSELSNQLRYATQKRILLEVTVIKLCIPEMEQDSESVIDRVRVLEEKVKNGVRVAPSENDAYSTPAQGNEVPRETPKAVITKALPEDIKEVVSKWSMITSANDTLTQYLKGSYPSVGDNDTLVVVVDSIYSYRRFTDATHADELKSFIVNITGKEMNVSVVMPGNAGVSEDTYPDVRSFVDEKIDFDIDEIDDEDIEDYDDIEERD